MKKPSLTSTLIAVSFLATFGYSNMAAAHTISGSLGAGSANEPAIDVYRANCFAYAAGDPNIPAGEVAGDGVKMTIQIEAVTGVALTARAARVSDSVGFGSVSDSLVGNGTPGTAGNKTGTNGDFYLYVQKTTAGDTTPSTYNLTYHCQNNAGQHTGTTDETAIIGAPYFLQNQ